MNLRIVGWLLAVATSAFALASVFVYLATGTFSQTWLVASAVVYGAVLVTALLLLATDRAPAKAPVLATAGEPRLVERTCVYRTQAGEVWRLTYAGSDERREVRHVATCAGEMLTAAEIETYVDALPPSPVPQDFERILDAALERHTIPEPKPKEVTA